MACSWCRQSAAVTSSATATAICCCCCSCCRLSMQRLQTPHRNSPAQRSPNTNANATRRCCCCMVCAISIWCLPALLVVGCQSAFNCCSSKFACVIQANCSFVLLLLFSFVATNLLCLIFYAIPWITIHKNVLQCKLAELVFPAAHIWKIFFFHFLGIRWTGWLLAKFCGQR